MCGIAGLINFGARNTCAAEVQQMVDTLLHRGPDGTGTYQSSNGEVAFGAARLAIVDIENGVQPVVILHRNDEFSIVFNGEIYNYASLRTQLEDFGHIFRTDCDTEVALRCYMQWGTGAFSKFDGQFAIAIYDSSKSIVLLARDCVGIKPLYYHHFPDGGFAFASEPKAILSNPKVHRKPDAGSLAEYFLCSYILPNGSLPVNKSFFEGIASLEPGCFAIVERNEITSTRFYNLPEPTRTYDSTTSASMEQVVRNAIIKRVPVEAKFGILLSGGLDSSINAAVLTEANHHFPCVTINYEGQSNPDVESARIVAKEFRQKLFEDPLTPEYLLSLIDPLVQAFDGPHDALRHLGMFAAYRILHDQGCKVAIVGEGSDEFNLGYYWFYPGFGVNEEPWTPDVFAAFASQKIPLARKWFTKEFLANICFEEIVERQLQYCELTSEDPTDRAQRYYINKFLKYRLDANDLCGMANSIESRVPFCDKAVIEQALSVPHKANLDGSTEKAVLRTAFKKHLPPIVCNRRKFPIPNCDRLSLLQQIVERLADECCDRDALHWTVIDRLQVEKLCTYLFYKIAELIKTNRNGRDLVSDSVCDPEFRAKDAFLILTLVRWHRVYFDSLECD